jgi:hypothetical protein
LQPFAWSAAMLATTSATGAEVDGPRARAMMQKVQAWSQPFWTGTKARV